MTQSCLPGASVCAHEASQLHHLYQEEWQAWKMSGEKLPWLLGNLSVFEATPLYQFDTILIIMVPGICSLKSWEL